MIDLKTILILAICFLALFLIKRFIFKKLFVPLCIFIVILFSGGLKKYLEEPISKKSNAIILLSIAIYGIFDFLEHLLLFSTTTLIIYNTIYFLSHMLWDNQLLSAYLAVTLTLTLTCYASKYYGLVYKLLSFRRKSANEPDDSLETQDEETQKLKELLEELIRVFSKHERYKNIFYEDKLKLFAYLLAFCVIFVSKVEFFFGSPLFSNNAWIDLSKVALESSVTFIAFDRLIGHIKKLRKEQPT